MNDDRIDKVVTDPKFDGLRQYKICACCKQEKQCDGVSRLDDETGLCVECCQLEAFAHIPRRKDGYLTSRKNQIWACLNDNREEIKQSRFNTPERIIEEIYGRSRFGVVNGGHARLSGLY